MQRRDAEPHKLTVSVMSFIFLIHCILQSVLVVLLASGLAFPVRVPWGGVGYTQYESAVLHALEHPKSRCPVQVQSIWSCHRNLVHVMTIQLLAFCIFVRSHEQRKLAVW